jgi:hypothetical protein
MKRRSGPNRSELVPDSEFERLIEGLCKRPGMYLGDATLLSVLAYFQGLDDSKAGGLLVGLHQWLVLKENGGTNVCWTSLAEFQVRERIDPEASDDVAIAALGALLIEFIHYRRTNGLTKIFYDFGKWNLRRSWYDGPLRSPPIKRSATSWPKARR